MALSHIFLNCFQTVVCINEFQDLETWAAISLVEKHKQASKRTEM